MISKLRLFTLLAFVFGVATARAEFRVPSLTGPVVDQADVLSGDAELMIDGGLRRLLALGGTQVNVLTVTSLEGLPIEQASIQVTDAWKLGTAKDDKGVLLLIAPKERALRIEVGQGLEGVLTDADSKRIISETITPLFRQSRFDEGVLMGLVEIMRRTNPDLDPRQVFGAAGEGRGTARDVQVEGGLGKLLRWFLILMFILFIIRPRRRRRGFASGLLWGAATGWGARGWSSGRGWGGGGGFGGGGGGWGGGGGGFSGGGASGNW